ncbi:MAG: hypothetical protein ACK4SJ_06165 [Sphingorhabdus sp.]
MQTDQPGSPLADEPAHLFFGSQHACYIGQMRAHRLHRVVLHSKEAQKFAAVLLKPRLDNSNVENSRIWKSVPKQAICLRNAVTINISAELPMAQRKPFDFYCGNLVQMNFPVPDWIYQDVNIAWLPARLQSKPFPPCLRNENIFPALPV